MSHFDHILTRQPDAPEAHFEPGVAVAAKGRFRRGWPAYEWRWKQRGAPNRKLTEPLWDGSDLRGRAILLYAEQGFGDSIQFIRYAALVKNRGGTVIVECQPALVKLLSSRGDAITSCPWVERCRISMFRPP